MRRCAAGFGTTCGTVYNNKRDGFYILNETWRAKCSAGAQVRVAGVHGATDHNIFLSKIAAWNKRAVGAAPPQQWKPISVGYERRLQRKRDVATWQGMRRGPPYVPPRLVQRAAWNEQVRKKHAQSASKTKPIFRTRGEEKKRPKRTKPSSLRTPKRFLPSICPKDTRVSVPGPRPSCRHAGQSGTSWGKRFFYLIPRRRATTPPALCVVGGLRTD